MDSTPTQRLLSALRSSSISNTHLLYFHIHTFNLIFLNPADLVSISRVGNSTNNSWTDKLILLQNNTVAYHGTLIVSNSVTNYHFVYIMVMSDYHIHVPWYLHITSKPHQC